MSVLSKSLAINRFVHYSDTRSKGIAGSYLMLLAKDIKLLYEDRSKVLNDPLIKGPTIHYHFLL